MVKKKVIKKATKKVVKKSSKKKVMKSIPKVDSKKSDLAQIAFWTPRILTALLIIIISFFSLEVYSEYSGSKVLLALSLHLIPPAILLIFLIIAWNHEKIGAELFIALGIIFGIFFEAFKSMDGFLVLVLPLWLMGVLFWISNNLNSK